MMEDPDVKSMSMEELLDMLYLNAVALNYVLMPKHPKRAQRMLRRVQQLYPELRRRIRKEKIEA